MKLEGRAIKIGDNINTDFIISGRYKFSVTDLKELARHIMEDIDPDFPSRITPGRSILVAGANFGMGSSREQAPLVIRESGIIACIAKSFARIFYRNAFNIGLAAIELNTDKIRDGAALDIDLDAGLVRVLPGNFEYKIKPLPQFMQSLLKEGGVVNYINKHKGLSI